MNAVGTLRQCPERYVTLVLSGRSFMEFIYREKKYSWEEFVNEQKTFVDSLDLPDSLRIEPGFREFCILHDIGYGIGCDKFAELYSMIASARFALIQAHEKFYDSNVISWESGYEAQLWMRFQYLKNAIVWYNSCEDYIYQIIWFAFDMYTGSINNEKNYLQSLKDCSYSKVSGILKSIGTKDARDLLEHINLYRFNRSVKFIRELANSLKHRANVQVKGLENTRTIGFSIKGKDGVDKFNSDWIKPQILDIDNTISVVKDLHEKLIEFSNFMLDYLNLDMMFETENGTAILNNVKPKSTYKRILVK
jgi:hypothetical protein